jgi:hypothetical protein
MRGKPSPSSCNAFQRSSEPQCRVAVQFGQEASKTRDYRVARSATPRAARPDPSLRKERLLQDDNQTASLPNADPAPIRRDCHRTVSYVAPVSPDGDFYSDAVRSRDPQTIVLPSQLYRQRFAVIEEYGKKITFRFGNRLVYPPPSIYAFHRFSVSAKAKSMSSQDLHAKS